MHSSQALSEAMIGHDSKPPGVQTDGGERQTQTIKTAWKVLQPSWGHRERA